MPLSYFRLNAPSCLGALLMSLILGACAGDDADLADEASSELSSLQWQACAQSGQFCAFEGTHVVRYGAGESYTSKGFTNGVQCLGSAFGVPSSAASHCEVLYVSPFDLTATSSGSRAYMPFVDMSAIPRGSPGVPGLQLRATSEKPVPADIGAFRTSCQFSHMSKDDPIVFFGQPGKSHLHAFFGNTLTDAFSTATSLRARGNSTCRGGIVNRSAYWVPAVIDPRGRPVAPQSAQIYYKTGYNGIAPRDVRVFPRGLRMIAGNAKATGPGQLRAAWSCETYNGHPNAIPDCAAGERVIMVVQFPQCWNGRDLDSSDHQSHMAYPADGRCPSTHPVPIPEITFNIYYAVPAGARSSQWRLASDMYNPALPGGYSAHGDWFEGWDPAIAASFVKNCDQASVDCHSHLLGDGREIFNSLEPMQ